MPVAVDDRDDGLALGARGGEHRLGVRGVAAAVHQQQARGRADQQAVAVGLAAGFEMTGDEREPLRQGSSMGEPADEAREKKTEWAQEDLVHAISLGALPQRV